MNRERHLAVLDREQAVVGDWAHTSATRTATSCPGWFVEVPGIDMPGFFAPHGVICANNPVNSRDPFGLCKGGDGGSASIRESTLDERLRWSYREHWQYPGYRVQEFIKWVVDPTDIPRYGWGDFEEAEAAARNQAVVYGVVPVTIGPVASAGGANIVFRSQHAAGHLQGTGLSPSVVETSVRAQIITAVSDASATGNFWGRVTVGGQAIEYRAYTLANGTINVGTYYPVHQ